MKRSYLVIGGLTLLLIVLAAGAFTAVRLLAKPEAQTSNSGGGRVIQSVVDNGSGPVSVRTTFIPAPELPEEPAAGGGILVQREDNSLIMGTGDIEMAVEVEVDGATGQERTSVVPSASGPELEVVLTADTVLYRDVTDLSADAPTESGEREVQQVIRRMDTADEIEGNMELQVWGRRSGDRIIADVVVYGPLGGGMFE